MIKQNLTNIVARIEQARLAYSSHQIIKLVAVSKYHTTQEISELYHAGQRAFGENKVQDLCAKSQALAHLPLEWHFIGTLQKNKISALLAMNPMLIHSLDSMPLALALNKHCQKLGITQDVLLQINASNEDSKHGFVLESSLEMYLQIQETCHSLCLRGLMTIGKNTQNTKEIDSCFAQVKRAFDMLPQADILSMGMSSDFEIAIANGANLVRIGSALFQ